MQRHVIASICLLSALCSAPGVYAQAPGFGFSPPPGIAAQDEGTPIAGRTLTINCVGSTIACAGVPITTITITGGAGAANAVSVSVDFGTDLTSTKTATVTGQTWVTTSSLIVCQPQATDADGQTIENYFVTPFHPTVSNLVAGIGFDVTVLNPTSAAGIFRFSCTGV